MKIAINIMAVVSILLLLSTLICGLWMKAQPAVDPSSVNFHVTLGIATVIVTLITLVLVFIRG
jgi:cytochrome b561